MKSFDQLLTPARLKRIEAFGLTVEQVKELIFHTAPSTDVTLAGATSVPVGGDTVVGNAVAIGGAIGGTVAGIAAVVVAVGAYMKLSDAKNMNLLLRNEIETRVPNAPLDAQIQDEQRDLAAMEQSLEERLARLKQDMPTSKNDVLNV